MDYFISEHSRSLVKDVICNTDDSQVLSSDHQMQLVVLESQPCLAVGYTEPARLRLTSKFIADQIHCQMMCPTKLQTSFKNELRNMAKSPRFWHDFRFKCNREFMKEPKKGCTLHPTRPKESSVSVPMPCTAVQPQRTPVPTFTGS